MGIDMNCLDEIEHEVLLDNVSFKEARKFIEENSDRIHYVNPGYKIFLNCYLIGVPPIPLGVKGNKLIIPIVRPRWGTSVIRVNGREEIELLEARAEHFQAKM